MPIKISRANIFLSTFYILIHIFSDSFSQNGMFPFERFNERNGLPAPVRKIIQDSWGFIWIATSDGLTRYDGKQFKVYRNKLGDGLTIPNNIINDICLDHSGNIWIATNGGLCFYSYENDKFYQIYIPDTLEKTDRYRVHCLAIDYLGQIWFATKTAVHQLTENHQIGNSYNLPFDKNAIIKSIYLNSKNQLFIGNNRGELWMLDICTNKVYSTMIFSIESKRINLPTTIRIIIPFKKDTLIIGSWMGGLNKVYFLNEKLNVVHFENSIEKDYQKNIVTGVGILNDSLWWVGTFGSGIALFNPINGITAVQNKMNNQIGL